MIKAQAALSTAPATRLRLLPTLLAAAGLLAATQLAAQRLPTPLPAPAKVSVEGQTASTGRVRVIVQFAEAPVTRMRAKMDLSRANRAEMAAYRQKIMTARQVRLARIAASGGQIQNTVEFALNGAVVDVRADRIESLRRIPGVKSVRLARDYQMNQSATPPTVGELIGTAQTNAGGNRGQGVAIAIIDSGVDYTHAAFGGPGTTGDYAANTSGTNPLTLGAHNAGLFPDGPRVKGGYDWLGDTWTGSAADPGGLTVSPDPNPIDNKQLPSDFAGHGTNSASAAAGQAVPGGGLRDGSAPGAYLLAYRGCSRISRSCEGSALLNSVESVVAYAAGFPNQGQTGANNPPLPNGTRFVINMSLGASFGSPLTDDLSEASRNAARAGIAVVASAGNSGDIPFVTGTPGAADMVLSVAASEPALLTGPGLNVGPNTFALGTASFGPPLSSEITLPLAFAGISNTTNLACTSVGVDLTDKAGVADRGTCAFVLKAQNIQAAGGDLALIVNNVPGGPPGLGGIGPVSIPTLSISLDDGNVVKAAMAAGAVTGKFLPRADLPNVIGGLNLSDQIAGFSSRGPTQNFNAIKPEITAPGVNIFMANVGTGTGGAPSSGTSFSSPLTAGAAALVLSKRPDFAPWEVKAALMNTANPDVFRSKAAGTLVGITRMGAGRLQADRAVATTTLAYDSEDIDPQAGTFHNASLSFGPQAFVAPGASSVKRTVTVRNLGVSARSYSLSTSLRFANDAAKGISFSTSAPTLTVAPGSTGSFDVIATATGTALPTVGGLPDRLQQTDACTLPTNPPTVDQACTDRFDILEVDGFVAIDGGSSSDRVTVPFLIYPRQASDVGIRRIGRSVIASNPGAANTFVDVFNLIGVRDAQDQPALVPGSDVLPVDIRAVGMRFLPGAFGEDGMQFAISTWHPMDTLRFNTFNIELDTNGDGVTDFTVHNLNTTLNTTADFITPAGGAPGLAFFFTTQAINSSNAILTILPNRIGITAGTRLGIRVKSSNGFGLPTLDQAPDNGGFLYVQPDKMVVNPSALDLRVLSGGSARLNYTVNAANSTVSPGDKGLLLLHTDNPTGNESTVVQLVN
jgi:subtilisin family serine protease